jgi:hypothetical protein
MDRMTTIEDVRSFETRRGNVRYVVRDADGNEYTTFREAIGESAGQLKGQRVRLDYHEEQRGDYHNVYLDKVQAAPADPSAADGANTDPEEAAWRTAVDAAPWLVGEAEPEAKTASDDLYETLKPFKDKVARDIKDSERDRE